MRRQEEGRQDKFLVLCFSPQPVVKAPRDPLITDTVFTRFEVNFSCLRFVVVASFFRALQTLLSFTVLSFTASSFGLMYKGSLVWCGVLGGFQTPDQSDPDL